MKDKNFTDKLVCPICHCNLVNNISEFICSSCGRHYPNNKGISDFRERNDYWCNVSREKMEELINLAKDSGNWLKAAEEIVPEYTGHFVPFDRADCQFLWPCTKDSKILDAGSMWGGITIPAAQFHAEVYAVDKTVETLEFLKIRAEQMGFDNIYTVACGLKNLPFPDDFFDLVVLNGALEWVALEEEIILEKHWRKFGRGLRRRKSIRYSQNPNTMQIQVLQEMRRVLKPGGCLYLAIENRIGYIYLVGYPDDHMNMPFISFMPRAVANAITKLISNCEYRTYVYTIPGYNTLLKHSGFGHVDFYGAFMHYINPSEVVPLDLIKKLREKILSSKRGLNKALLSLIPRSSLKWLVPSVVAIAAKSVLPSGIDPRLIQLLKKAGLLDNSPPDVKIVKCDSRIGSDLTVNYWVYNGSKNKPEYFCKICRNRKSVDILKSESQNLKTVNHVLKDTELSSNIPELLYYGSIDNITFKVMGFINARNSIFNFDSRLKTKLKYLDKEIKMAIRFLSSFQKYTATRQIEIASFLIPVLENYKKILEKRNLLTKDIEASINRLEEEINQLKDLTIALCAQHGDYDFFYNILFNENGVQLVDFEHFQREALPFLDLATLIFNPILVSRERKRNGLPIHILLSKYNLKSYIGDWFNLYAKLSGVSKELLRLVPPLAALEQKTKEYPHHRNPETFPINKAFEELLKLRINLS